jgi:hypothetical protein
MIIEIVVLLLAVLAVIVIYKVVKAIIPLVLHAILALIALWLLNVFGLNIAINILTVLIVAIGGFVGLALVVLLHVLGIAF